MKRFEKVQLGSIADIRGGKRLPNGADFSIAPTGHPYIRARDIGQGKVQIDDPVYLSDDIAQRIAHYTVKAGDVCLTIVGANVGDIGAVPQELDGANLTENAVKIVANGKADQAYLKYALLSQDAVAQMKVLAGGAAQPKLGIYKVETIEIPLAPLPLQRRIAGILSAYDELMENNQRRIKILEEMARSLYREWFVHFRFPGHDKVKMVPSPLGPIPQGWEVKKLSEVADVNRAQINPRNPPGEILYIDISSVSPGQINSITMYPFAEAPGRARRIVQHGDIIWSCVRPNRRSHTLILQPDPNTVASTGFAVLTATKVPFTFLYFSTTTDDFVTLLANNATGAAYPAVTAKTFEDAVLLTPSAPLLMKFGETTIPMAEQIHFLQCQTKNLRRTRDLLLPRLLSGSINLTNVSVADELNINCREGN
jgi:type I restriction enzyme S subunit